ncbi:MAG: DUF2752 domain-containing protein [Lachnospiraceae bacterium]|nr:DUF2752 domain-containing protein [Lachnospiraceae bacterium]
MQNVQTVLERIWMDIKSFRVAILALILYNVLVRGVYHAFCPQLILTGFPCAGCGMTRAVFCILTGSFVRGMQLNPAAPLWILFLCWFFGNRYLRGVCPKRTTLWLALVCVITLGIYIYRMLHFFPGEPPMVYYGNNILRRVFLGEIRNC